MKVVTTATAEHGLNLIADTIARDSPRRALSFVRELRDKALGLADNPLAFRLIPRYERLGVRRRVHGDFLILYRIEGDQIMILSALGERVSRRGNRARHR